MIFILLFPVLAFSSVNGNVGFYSDFIWRGTTFSEHRPAAQAVVDGDLGNDFFLSGFFSNAEFSDPGMHEHSEVSSEMDLTLSKTWKKNSWEVQAYYSRFFFPNAGVFDSDEWNLQVKYEGYLLELSLMDDYFGYHSRYTYVKVAKEWEYWKSFEGALSVGYNAFERPKGSIRTREEFETLDGAGNTDYFDLFFTNRKKLPNKNILELSLNWTNRQEYSVDQGMISKNDGKDFVIVVSYVLPFSL